MNTPRFVHWRDGGMWLGYFEEFPDYLTQGESLEELETNLRDLHQDLTVDPSDRGSGLCLHTP